MKQQTKTAALLILLITSVIYVSMVIYSDSKIQFNGKMNLLKDSDRQAEKYLKEGKHHFEEKRFAKAVESHRKAIEIDPQYSEAYCNLGRALNGLKRY